MCRSGAVDDPLETLIRAIERFVEVPTLELTPTELGDHLVRLRHGIDVLELGFASSAMTFAATDEYDAQGSVTRSTGSVITATCPATPLPGQSRPESR